MLFLSYNSKDRRYIEQLKRLLAGFGVKTWLDTENLPYGIPYQRALESSLVRSTAVVVAVGAHGLGPVQQREFEAAEALRKPIVPVLLPGAPPTSMGAFLRTYRWIDLTGGVASGDWVGPLLQLCGVEDEAGGATPTPAATPPTPDLEARLQKWLAEALGREPEFTTLMATLLDVEPADATHLATRMLAAEAWEVVSALDDTCAAVEGKRSFLLLVAELIPWLLQANPQVASAAQGELSDPRWHACAAQSNTLLELAIAAQQSRPSFFEPRPGAEACGLTAKHVSAFAVTHAPIPETEDAKRIRETVAHYYGQVGQAAGLKQFAQAVAEGLALEADLPERTLFEVNGSLRTARTRFQTWQARYEKLGARLPGPPAPPTPYLVVDQDPEDRWRAALIGLSTDLPELDLVVRPQSQKTDWERALAQALTRVLKTLRGKEEE
ncbi:MAG: toll/interleukin-1 receptor domain-containing protein [Myxococcales bacterium]|nr:toll/interleukin-1 receptor domain-containing protein [Myxococcales bacterium]